MTQSVFHLVVLNDLWSQPCDLWLAGEASASTMWDNNAWSYLNGDATEPEPPFLTQDFIHALQPKARFVAILRDPVERSEVKYYIMVNVLLTTPTCHMGVKANEKWAVHDFL